jgi:Flp pilus assembly protein TadG
MGNRRTQRGQALLELVVILPVLLILLMGLVEIGYALRDYLVVVNACREGCRFAARGRFGDEDVGERVITSGGTVRLGDPPSNVSFLRTAIEGPDPNTAVIVTNIPTDSAGEPISVTVWTSGVLPNGAGDVRPIEPSDTMISQTQVIDRHRPVTQLINVAREDAGYERMGNHVVVVEVFFMHHPLWNNPFVPLPDPWMMYAKTEMRVVTDRENIR